MKPRFSLHIISLLLMLACHLSARALTVTAVSDEQVDHAYLNNVASGSTAKTSSQTTAINLSTYYAKILSDLGLTENAAGQQIYVRWYVENADGSLADVNNFLSPATASAGHSADSQCLYWLQSLATSRPFTSANAAAILNVNLTNASAVGMKVVALIAKIDDTNPITTADGAVTAEPAHFQLKYSFRIVDQTNAQECYITTKNLPTRQKVRITDESATSYTVTTGNAFTRIYMIDKSTGEILENCQNYINYVTTNWAAIGCFYKTPYGLTAYARSEASGTPGNVVVTLPEGKTWKDVIIVRLQGAIDGIVAGNLSNVNTKYPNYFVAQDPTAFTSRTEYMVDEDLSVSTVADDEVEHVYLNNIAPGRTYYPTSTSTLVSLSPYYDKILSDLGLTENAAGQQIYVRWCVENADGTLADAAISQANNMTSFSKGLYWYQPLHESLPFTKENAAAILNVNYNNTGIAGQKIVALIAKVDNPLSTKGNLFVTEEPTKFQLKYVFRIVDQTTAQANYIATTTNLPKVNYSVLTDKSATTITLPTPTGYNIFSRFYLIDRSTGQMIANSADYFSYNSKASWTQKGCFYKTPYGMSVYSRETATQDPGNIIVTLPTGMTMKDVKIVKLQGGIEGLVAGNTKENASQLYPDYFVAQDPTTFTSMTEYLTINPVDVDIDAVADASVTTLYKRYVASGKTATPSSDVTALRLGDYYNKILSDLGLTENADGQSLYIRWYLENADGTLAPTDGKLTSANASGGQVAITNGLYWCSQMSSLKFTSANAANILNVNYENAGAKDKKIVALIAKIDDTNAPTMVDGVVTAEPARFDLKYVFTIVDETMDKSAYICTPNLPTVKQSYILDKPHATYWDLPTLTAENQFMRIYMIDKNTGDMIENSQNYINYTTTNWASVGCFYKNAYGVTVYTRKSASTNNAGTVRITIPEGKTKDDIKVVVLYSNNVNSMVAFNLDDVNHQYPDYFIAQDPANFTSATEYTIQLFDFVHSSGYAYNYDASGLKDGRQQVYEWDYDYYVKPGEQRRLYIPIADESSIEPTGYWRWYDYGTDRASDLLSTNSTSGATLEDLCYDSSGKSYGLFRYEMGTNDWASKQKVAAVMFTTPSTGWTGSDIACDMSRYRDYFGSRTDVKYEPTLSLRYLFRVRPATEIADKIKKSILAGHPLEDNGHMTLGLFSGYKGNITLRTGIRDLSMYYFYPYTNMDFSRPAEESMFGADLCQGKTVTWTVVTRIGTKYYYHVLTDKNGAEAKMLTDYSLETNMESFKGEYKPTSVGIDETSTETKVLNKIEIGHPYYVIAYVNDFDSSTATKKNTTPVVRYICYFRAESAPQDIENLDYSRTDSVLNQNYTKVAEISFDDEEGMNFNKPDKIYQAGYDKNNQWNKPLDWSKSYYGFVYPDLASKMHLNSPWMQKWYKYSPYHGDYVIIKSMNDPLASPNAEQGYALYDNTLLYDVTYYKTGGKKYGYFVYVDATDEARPVITTDFDATLCEGSTVIASIAVANMTNKNAVAPQLVFKLYGEAVNQQTGETERQLVQSFASGDFKSVGADSTGRWYQIYAPSVIAAGTHPEKYSHFIITVDNQGASTGGNDFCIDDIRIYVKNPKISVMQQSDDTELCKNRENGAKLKLTMVYSQVKEALELSDNDDTATDDIRPLFYRLCHADTGQPVSLEYGDSLYNRGHTAEYGCILVHSTDELNRKNLYVDNNEYYHLILANRFFQLDPQKEYYISIATPERRIINGVETYLPSSWGTPDATCSIYSESMDYVQQDAIITDENGAVNATFSAECGATTVNVKILGKLSLPDAVNGGRLEVNRWPFDWFTGSVAEFQSISGLNAALINFRSEYPDATDLQPIKGVFTQENYDLLQRYVNGVTNNATGYEHKLYLLASYKFEAPFELPEEGDRVIHVTLLPIEGNYTDSRTIPAQVFTICGYPLEASATLTHDGPVLNLGYPSVDYPDSWTHTARYLRLGLQQLTQLEQANTYLRIPIHSYVDAQRPITTTNLHNLQLITRNADDVPAQLVLAATNDPLNTANIGKSIATAQSTIIQPTSRNIAFNFAPAATNGITFHEGYDYTLELKYHDATQDASSINTCRGITQITLQIVPEYVTWTNVQANNNNWNFDQNWRRANKSELYKNDYQDYGTDIPGLLQAAGTDASTTPQAFIPMRFTKVIVPADVEAPFLGTFTVSTKDSLLTYLDNAVNAPATDNIAYYLMAKTSVGTSGANKYIDCERFYANTCDQVYFKPRGELRNQQYLQYNKAWVDLELTPDQWTLWTSPLKDVYAGDFYVPAATGRQESEAFLGMQYNPTINSRAGYPIYQRSWDKASSLVITDPDDALRDDYNAYIDYADYSGSDPLAVLQQWSNRYNDVTVPYAPGQGVSVLSEDKTKVGGETLIRLPKADTQYAYYRTDGTAKQTVNLPTRTEPGRLATSDAAISDPQKLSGRLVITTDQANAHADNGYYLVGNPYMARLYMKRFFDQNTQLYPKYWTMVDGEMKAFDASAANAVAPMQAFFVKPVSGTLLQNIEFTAVMTVPYTSAVANSAEAQLTLTATTTDGKAVKAKVIAEKSADNDFHDAEDVEAMFDSNAELHAPVLYTMAGQMAAAINHVPDLRNVPLAILSNDSTQVQLSVTGMELLRQPVYLYDAAAHTTTQLHEGNPVSVSTNAIGRYFLTSEAIEPGKVQTALRCYAIEGSRIVASTTPDDRITSVLVFTPDGRLVREFKPNASTATYTLPASATYLITVSSEKVTEGRTFKVVVR